MSHTKSAFKIILFLFLSSAAQAANTKYFLDVQLSPSDQSITVEGRIEDVPKELLSEIFLNRRFVFDYFGSKAGKNDVQAVIDHDSNSPDEIDIAKHVTLLTDLTGNKMFFKYHGKMNEPANESNMITGNLVELASYSGWYPFLRGLKNFEFEIHVSAPKNFVVTSNGVEKSKSGGLIRKAQYSFESFAPASDIVIVAAPDLETKSKTADTIQVEVVAPKKSKVDVAGRLDVFAEAAQKFSTWLGPLPKGFFRYVYSPRGGPDYSRNHVVVLSNEHAESSESSVASKQADMMESFVPLSHVWWENSDMHLPSDGWVHEGLAEYTGFAFASEKFGDDMRAAAIKKYFDQVAGVKVDTPIDQTDITSPDRYANRTAKTVLVFCMLEKKLSRTSIFRALRAVIAEAKTREAVQQPLTTEKVIEIIRMNLDKEAGDLAKEYITTPWTPVRTEHLKQLLSVK